MYIHSTQYTDAVSCQVSQHPVPRCDIVSQHPLQRRGIERHHTHMTRNGTWGDRCCAICVTAPTAWGWQLSSATVPNTHMRYQTTRTRIGHDSFMWAMGHLYEPWLYIYIHTYTYKYVYIYMNTYIYICIYKFTYMHTYMWCIYIYVHIHIHMYIYTHIYTYIHIHIYTYVYIDV